jgi:hypothetical protein
MNHATAPAPGRVVATSGPVAGDTWTSVDITALVHGEGVLDVVLTGDDRPAALYASRETGATAPSWWSRWPGHGLEPDHDHRVHHHHDTPVLGDNHDQRALDEHDDHDGGAAPSPDDWLCNPGTPVLGILGVEPCDPGQRPAGLQLGRHDPPPVQRRALQRDQRSLGADGGAVFYADASTPRYTWGAHGGAISGKQVPPARLTRGPGPWCEPCLQVHGDRHEHQARPRHLGSRRRRTGLPQVGYQGAGVIESLTTANDGAPGHQRRTGADRRRHQLPGGLPARLRRHPPGRGRHLRSLVHLPWTRSDKLLVVRDRWELG